MDKEALLESAAERLKGGTEESRYQMVKGLSQLNSPRAIPFLVEAVGDESYRVREEALGGICSFPSEVVFPWLGAFLRNHDNANLRNAAMEAFPRYGAESTPYLVSLLNDKDEEVRMFSSVILGEVGDTVAVEPLVKALKDPDENVKHAAAESLGKLKAPHSVGPLVDCLIEDFWIQYPAVIALGNIGDPGAIEPLLKLLDDEMLRQAVIEALGKIGDLSVVPALADILSQNDPSIRNDTIAALVNIQSRLERHIMPEGTCVPSIKETLDNAELIDHLLNSLQDPDLEVRKNAVVALGWLKQKRAVKRLVELLRDYDLEEYVVGSLVSIGDDALPELIRGLENQEPKFRALLIRCIGWLDNMEGIRACLPFLRDEDNLVRHQAVIAMAGGLDSEEVEDALLTLLSDPEPEIRGALIEVMGKSRSKRLIKKLLSDLSIENGLRKVTTIQILGRLKEPKAFPPLQNLLKDKSNEIRAEVYRALSAINPNKMSTKILMAGLSDESPTVRKAAASCFSGLTRKNAEGSLINLLKDPDPGVRLAALESLGQIGSISCVEHLMEAFTGGNKRLRLTIIRAMGNIRDKTCTKFLTDLLKEADTDIKRATLESLSQIRDKRSVPNLIVALDDGDWSVRSAAIEALGKIGDRKCIGHLLEKLEDREDIIKKGAITALGELGAEEAVNSILPFIHNENLELEVISTLEKLGIPDLEFFFDFLKRANTRLKCLLVDMLGRLKDPSAVDYLVGIFGDEFFTVRCRAAKTLGELGDRKAIPALLKALKEDPSEEVQKEATRALKRLKASK